MKLELPLIINENGDISFYPSVEEGELALEPIDVRNNEYTAYDSEGRKLEFRIAEEEKIGLFGLCKISIEVVKICAQKERPEHREELKQILIEYLSDYVLPRSLVQKATLKELVDILTRH